MEAYPNLKAWKPGQSGNLNGRPVGSRTAFSAGFLKDLAEIWSEEGRGAMLHILGRLPPLLRPLPHSAFESHGRALADSDCNRPSRASRAIPKR